MVDYLNYLEAPGCEVEVEVVSAVKGQASSTKSYTVEQHRTYQIIQLRIIAQ
jgi:hypothetical protein